MAKGSSFDDVVGGVSIGTLQRELAADQRRADQRRFGQINEFDQIEDLRYELEDLTRGIQQLRRLLGAAREIEADAGSDRQTDQPPAMTKPEMPPPMTKPEIVERVLGDSREPLYPRQVRDVAVNSGWLPDNAASRNQLGVAMSKMARKGRLVKDDDGRYSIPSKEYTDPSYAATRWRRYPPTSSATAPTSRSTAPSTASSSSST